MNFERLRAWLPFPVLLGTGVLLAPLVSPPTEARGLLPTLVADWSWLKANLAWEAHDEPRARAWALTSVTAVPRVDYFRVNAARMCAFDFPVWREQRQPDAPAGARTRWREAYADEALALLLRDEPMTAARLIEAGNIALYARRDVAQAAELYRRAAERSDAPWHAGRIYAELLRQSGRGREALQWLRAWLPRLPADDPAAQRELVRARIAELEREAGPQ